MFRTIVLSAVVLLCLQETILAQAPPETNNRAIVTGRIIEKADKQPIAYAEVALMKGDKVITGTVGNEFGRYEIKNVPPGHYRVIAYIVGFRKEEADTTLVAGNNHLDFMLEPSDIEMEGVTVTANARKTRPSNKDLQVMLTAPVFRTSTYHASPMATPSAIIQQSVPGAVQAPTGEVHIQGQHAEYSYYVDGIPIPETMSEGMTELFDPRVVDRISFLVGDLPAEYSDALSVIDVRTKIPATKFSAGASGYVGSFNSTGQSLSLAAHTGNFSYFFAGSRKTTDRRIDTPTPAVFHDHGQDIYGFGKVQYIISPNDLLSLDLDQGGSRFEVPYDSTGGITKNDIETFADGFQNLIYRHAFDCGAGSSNGQFELALSHRQGSGTYTPGTNDVPSFFFAGNPVPYNIREDRLFNVYGAKSSVYIPESDELSLQAGASYFYTRGNENFSSFNGSILGPQSVETLQGYDLGAYVQGTYQPMPIIELDAGIRFDQHHAHGIGTESQLSPKIKLMYIPGLSTRIYGYYSRLFVPVLVEQLREITGANGAVSQVTLPVRGDYFEVGISHYFLRSVSAKLEGYYTQENPGMDNNTIPGTNIQTAVNIQQIFVRGVELGLNYSPVGPFSGYFNIAVSHAQGVGATTGGFLPALPPTTAFDLDHDQRITYSLGLNYERAGYFANLIASYGSGLTNGQINGHVAPHLIFDGSIGKTFYLGGFSLRPEVYAANILNHPYLLNGAFFNGANFGSPRSILFKVAFGLD